MKNNEGAIGLFDSGVGGTTVLKEMLKVLPNEKYIYYSDSKNNPYGDKQEEKIINICDEIVKKFIEKDCKVVIIACNTASAIAAEYLRKKYPALIIIAIEPAYKIVYDFSYEGSTLIMATKRTIESEKFKKLYNKYDNHKTYLLSCSGLADLIEEGNEKKILKYLEEKLRMYTGNISNVVLGCTHYPLIKNEIRMILGNVKFFDGSHGVAMHVKDFLEKEGLLNSKIKGEIEFIDSQNSKIEKDKFQYFLNKEII